jgi:hypothetical protein
MRITQWDQCLSTAESNNVLHKIAHMHLSKCRETGHKLAIEALLGVNPDDADFVGLCNYDLAFEDDIQTYRHLRQVLAFFTKREDLDIGVDTKAVAFETFIQTELKCSETNEIFRKYARGGFYFLPRVESVLFLAQRKIATILGDLPSLEKLKLRFGPGATTSVKKKNASARRKLSQMYTCSENAQRFLPELLAEMPGWSGFDTPNSVSETPYRLAPGRVSFVPKNAKTDRTIGTEPDLNQMVQLGIGAYIAERLRPRGVDIRDQTRNQRMAREGSITGALATLDLRSASGTIATLFVESLLPFEWFDFLRAIRTNETESPNGVLQLQQFSSMGNGFTFPLQTLIFYALAASCVDPSDLSQVSVYGDDIIVPTYAVELVIEVLTSCGFLINKEKSYWSGPFRESCGKDYVSGIDVRPSYVRGALSGVSCFTLHNFYVREWQPEFAQAILTIVDESLRLWGPDGYGDGHLLGDFDPVYPKRDLGWSGYTFETYTLKAIRAYYKLGADYVYPLYSIYMRDQPVKYEDGDAYQYLEDVNLQGAGSEGERKLLLRHRQAAHGPLRPARSDARYKLYNGKWYLEDTLPGYEGYKRIKIYTFSKP